MANPDYFTVAELQALPDCSGFTEAQILPAAAYFVAIVEREVGEPMIPRTITETFSGGGRYALGLSYGTVRSLTTVTVDGQSVSTSELTANHGLLRYLDRTCWSSLEPENVTVVYVAGEYATCPADVKDACLWATRDRLLSQSDQSGIDVRRTSVNTDFGTTNYILPGEKRPTGYPELDAVIASRIRTETPLGFA
jgi:hypothetical protein